MASSTSWQSAAFPSERCLDDVLAELSKPELAHLWGADETIGWIYQYFNPPEERKAMRDASQAPRNSRELAVRNQFFTPRYVVEFLTDNTLGRMWYEMRKADTALKDQCRYLVRRPNEIFLGPGERAPSCDAATEDLSQEELLKQPVHVEHRPQKNPHDLHVLDPACGSGHFLLYAFDLLECIYEEAWQDPESPKSETTGRTLREDFETIEDLRRAVPKLIIEYNLHGIDIDPRAAQIAALALWLRAQKAWKVLDVKTTERPRIERSNIVTAEPMPGEEDMRQEFTASLKPRVLGQLVDAVFEKMELAGEAGSLLKIEDEIKDAIAAAKADYTAEQRRRGDAAGYLPGMAPPREATLFDFTDLSEEEFWEGAEDLILAALKSYAEQAESGRAVRRRLFVEDAARGFAFIDLCRKRYDVALMNPPFGEFPTRAKPYSRRAFPNTYNDIFAAFTERCFWLLHSRGILGAITSRTGFFLTSFSRWRQEFLLQHATIECLADLGMGVMDDAMVEAASYCLARGRTPGSFLCLRILRESDKGAALVRCVEGLRCLAPDPHVFLSHQSHFGTLSGSPFVYWVTSSILRRLSRIPPISPDVIEVKQGLATADDPRFARALWEVPPHELRMAPGADGRWVPYVKGGSSQPWFAPITLVVNWGSEAAELYNNLNARGEIRSNIWMLGDAIASYFFRPGFSWTRRAVRFIPYIVPAGCIPSASRYMAYPASNHEYSAVGITASNVATSYLRFFGERFLHPNYMVEVVKTVPYAEPAAELLAEIVAHVTAEVDKRRLAYTCHEPFQEFCHPAMSKADGPAGNAIGFDYRTLLGRELDTAVASEYDLTGDDIAILERDFIEAVEAQVASNATDGEDRDEDDSDSETESEDVQAPDQPSQYRELLSYAVGVALARWDIRLAQTPSLRAKLPRPFDTLPVSPPGMLVGPDGLPARPGSIVSEEWLRFRPNAGALPPEGSVATPTIEDAEYPLRISWDGILVDDPGFNGGQPHRDDIVRRVREVLDLLWKDKAHAIEQEACGHLGVTDLRDYFCRPAGFFQDHLKRYSKSRRKAPVYWPLSNASGSYTIWLYYHRLTDQTLYAVVNTYLEPKISEVEHAAARIEKELETASGREASRLRDRTNEARAFVGELRELREDVMRVAALPCRPNLNDGVIINAAPFYKLFRLRPWARDTERVWNKLERGDYDWAHLAYTIWPERVKEACRKDRSIAIAHGLEDLCEVELSVTRKRAKGKGGKKRETGP